MRYLQMYEYILNGKMESKLEIDWSHSNVSQIYFDLGILSYPSSSDADSITIGKI